MSSVSDYEYNRGHYTSSERQLVRLPRDVIRAPTPPPVIQRVVERAPTPEPDILERVIYFFVKKINVLKKLFLKRLLSDHNPNN
jgi:hypothetical protein